MFPVVVRKRFGERFDYHPDFSLTGMRMKGLLIAAVAVAALYVADQQYAQGKYTTAIARMLTEMRHSFRI